MSSLRDDRPTVPRGVRCAALFVVLLLAFASPSAADILPREGTFSGVYHRDRWGVGRFKFFLVSPKLHERLKAFEDKPISLKVKLAQQAINPGPAEIHEIGEIKVIGSAAR